MRFVTTDPRTGGFADRVGSVLGLVSGGDLFTLVKVSTGDTDWAMVRPVVIPAPMESTKCPTVSTAPTGGGGRAGNVGEIVLYYSGGASSTGIYYIKHGTGATDWVPLPDNNAGGPTGSGTAGRSTRWTAATVVGTGAFTDDGTNVSLGGTLTLTPMTQGSVLFAGAGGLVSQDNTGLFFADATNRLGVGTNGPAALLHVTGSLAGADSIRTSNTESTGFAAIAYHDSSGNYKGATGLGNSAALDPTTQSKLFFRQYGVDLIFCRTTSTPSVAAMTLFDSSGNVRIGSTTSDPSVRLYVEGALTATGNTIVGTNTSNTHTMNGSETISNRLGLPTVNTSYKLTITQPGGSDGCIRLQGGSTGDYTGTDIYNSAGTIQCAYAWAGSAASEVNLRGNQYIWRGVNTVKTVIWDGYGSQAGRFWVHPGGNVNIGTTATDPGVLLKVEGAATVTGALSVEGNATIGNAAGDAHVVNGTVDFNHAINIDGAVTMTSTLAVTGAITENGVAVLSGAITANTIPKGSGGNLADSSITDDGTTLKSTNAITWLASNSGDGSPTALLLLGADVSQATNARNGFQVTAETDGNNYVDLKSFSGGYTRFRCGAGAEAGTARQWMEVTHSSGAVSMSGALSVNGNCTLGDGSGDSHTVNGALRHVHADAGTFAGLADWSNKFAVFSPNAASGTGAGVGIGFSTTVDSGVIVSRAPGGAYKDLYLGGSTIFLNPGGSSGISVSSTTTTVFGALSANGNCTICDNSGDTLKFYGGTGATKQTITGSRGGNAALADLLTKLATLGLITDSTSA